MDRYYPSSSDITSLEISKSTPILGRDMDTAVLTADEKARDDLISEAMKIMEQEIRKPLNNEQKTVITECILQFAHEWEEHRDNDPINVLINRFRDIYRKF